MIEIRLQVIQLQASSEYKYSCTLHAARCTQIQLINLNNSDTAYKQSPGHEERGLNIRRVPTLLIFGNQREVGRVVESPVTSLEKDILAIVSGQPYEHRYTNPVAAKPVNMADTTRLQPANRQ